MISPWIPPTWHATGARTVGWLRSGSGRSRRLACCQSLRYFCTGRSRPPVIPLNVSHASRGIHHRERRLAYACPQRKSRFKCAEGKCLIQPRAFGRSERFDPILPGHYVSSVVGNRSTVQSLPKRSIGKGQKYTRSAYDGRDIGQFERSCSWMHHAHLERIEEVSKYQLPAPMDDGELCDEVTKKPQVSRCRPS
jgi:hypothetical protein